MAKDNCGGMDWAKARQRLPSRLDEGFMYAGPSSPPEGLHKNCTGCPNIVDKKCKFVKYPKVRKWPCPFKLRAESK